MHQVSIKLSDSVYQRAAETAARTGKSIEFVVTEWLNRYPNEVPVELLTDEQVLALADMMMPDKQQEELSDLLRRNREGELDEAGKQRLDDLMEIYGHAQIRKAEAMAESVKRGLRSENISTWSK
jgi:predicted DNA-binding protein